jgi:hypothetical protein
MDVHTAGLEAICLEVLRVCRMEEVGASPEALRAAIQTAQAAQAVAAWLSFESTQRREPKLADLDNAARQAIRSGGGLRKIRHLAKDTPAAT